MNRHLIGLVSTLVMIGAAGCTQAEVDDESSSTADALTQDEQQAAAAAAQTGRPVVFELEEPAPRLNLTLPRDWSSADVEVQEYIDGTPAWLRAGTSRRPNIVETLRDRVGNGIGSGPCRFKVDLPDLDEVTVRCRWRF